LKVQIPGKSRFFIAMVPEFRNSASETYRPSLGVSTTQCHITYGYMMNVMDCIMVESGATATRQTAGNGSMAARVS
jgi:hypothetical protein